MDNYDVNSKFDIQKYKSTYVNYLEVIIDEYGEIHYAVPSHQEFLINQACKQLNITRDELYDMCPAEYHADFITWLCRISKCVAVWNSFIVFDYDSINSHQIASLTALNLHKLYSGMIPCVTKQMFEKENIQNEEN